VSETSNEKRTYPDGVPCWIDTEQPDPAAAVQFYGGLFGWTFEEAVPPGAPGSYLIAQLDGHDAAAIAPATGDDATWNTYIAVDDADRTAEVAAKAGATVVSPPEDVGPGGRGAGLIDPTGVPIRLWQPRRRLGAQIVNVPGAWNFSDPHTADTESAEAFYRTVFGWEADELDLGGGQTATMLRRPGYGDHLAATIDPDIYRRQAGIVAPPGFADAIAWMAAVDDGEHAHWHVTFAVADRDESVAAALKLGASDLSGPIDSVWNKTAIVRDPQGATFTLSQFTPPNG
jgi:predicted enzyme related to lactoylglutathione lyase